MQELFSQSYIIISKYISLLFDIERLNKLISNYKFLLIKKSISTNVYQNKDECEKTDECEKPNVSVNKEFNTKENDINDIIWGTYIQS